MNTYRAKGTYTSRVLGAPFSDVNFVRVVAAESVEAAYTILVGQLEDARITAIHLRDEGVLTAGEPDGLLAKAERLARALDGMMFYAPPETRRERYQEARAALDDYRGKP